jgi:fatty-acyl-CoA synthase
VGPRLSVSDRQQAINALHPTWHARRIDQLLDWAAETYEDRPYVVTDSGTWSYGQICDWSKQVAAGLIDIGVKAGDHVGLLMANFPEFVAAKYGIARAGATCIPINFLNRRHELAYVLRQSDAVALITMDSFRGLNYLEDLDAICPDWATKGGADTFPLLRNVVVMPTSEDQLPADILSFEDLCGRGDPEAIDPITYVGSGGLADILYTSGTTGEPKGVLLTHDMLLRTAFGSVFGRAFQDGRRITFSLPMYHVYGLVEGMLSVPFVGGAIIPELSFSAASTLEVIGRHQANDVLLIPTMTAAILDAYEKHPDTYDLSSLECMITSGGISPPGIWDRIASLLGDIELTTGYGMSETSGSSTVTAPDDPSERREHTNGKLRVVGAAGQGTEDGYLVRYRVIDGQTRTDAAPGSVGELVCAGIGVTKGYYKKPEETSATIDADGWLHTGDLGYFDEQGYLVLVGRVKETFRTGGEQVMPKEVEDIIALLPEVAQVHVVPLPDPRAGEVGVAYVVARDGFSIDPDAVIAHCQDRLARFKIPRHVQIISGDEVPTTPSGRPRKFLLAERARDEIAGGVS